jgi:acyl dehydratase
MIRLDRVGETIGPAFHEYGVRDVVLYHLGIGAGVDDLAFVYEGVRTGLQVCPTYAVVPSFSPLKEALSRLDVPMETILHGEETIVLRKEIPPCGRLYTMARVPAVYDKGKAALVIVETETTDNASGELLFCTRASIFCRGLGGFGGTPGPRGEAYAIPEERPPDFELPELTNKNQAILYRLSGDLNPLHIDSVVASAAGFPRPILHGLCTFGFAGRAVVKGACGNAVSKLKEFGCRFSAPVFPGEMITTRGWRMGRGLYHVRVSTERGDVLSNSYARVLEG